MRTLVDTNVILDILLERDEFFQDSYSVIKLATEGAITVLIPAGGISDIYYIIRRSGKDASAAHSSIRALLQLVEACDTAASDIMAALHLRMADLEDAILAATAKREKVDFIITRNEHDFLNSPVAAISPKAFLSQFDAVSASSS